MTNSDKEYLFNPTITLVCRVTPDTNNISTWENSFSDFVYKEESIGVSLNKIAYSFSDNSI